MIYSSLFVVPINPKCSKRSRPITTLTSSGREPIAKRHSPQTPPVSVVLSAKKAGGVLPPTISSAGRQILAWLTMEILFFVLMCTFIGRPTVPKSDPREILVGPSLVLFSLPDFGLVAAVAAFRSSSSLAADATVASLSSFGAIIEGRIPDEWPELVLPAFTVWSEAKLTRFWRLGADVDGLGVEKIMPAGLLACVLPASLLSSSDGGGESRPSPLSSSCVSKPLAQSSAPAVLPPDEDEEAELMLLGDDAGAELPVLPVLPVLLGGMECLSKYARPIGSFCGWAGGEDMDSQLLRLPVEPVEVEAVAGVVAALALARYLDLASGLNMVLVDDDVMAWIVIPSCGRTCVILFL